MCNGCAILSSTSQQATQAGRAATPPCADKNDLTGRTGVLDHALQLGVAALEAGDEAADVPAARGLGGEGLHDVAMSSEPNMHAWQVMVGPYGNGPYGNARQIEATPGK